MFGRKMRINRARHRAKKRFKKMYARNTDSRGNLMRATGEQHA
jgi:hypothetical protein